MIIYYLIIWINLMILVGCWSSYVEDLWGFFLFGKGPLKVEAVTDMWHRPVDWWRHNWHIQLEACWELRTEPEVWDAKPDAEHPQVEVERRCGSITNAWIINGDGWLIRRHRLHDRRLHHRAFSLCFTWLLLLLLLLLLLMLSETRESICKWAWEPERPLKRNVIG